MQVATDYYETLFAMQLVALASASAVAFNCEPTGMMIIVSPGQAPISGMIFRSRNHFFGLGLGLGLIVVGLGLDLGLVKFWSRSCELVSRSLIDHWLLNPKHVI